ncbi:MAG: aminotransferase class V-fold PLP-dependent enzyme [Vicinamibacteria bacterium]|jgi:isopenicillin-N epimerase|nr:aminotransferase class V-fold PLP-dependent enzyme [Vicinamibacteria bacterium]
MENRRNFLGALAAAPLVHGVLGRGVSEASIAPQSVAPTDAEVFERLRGEFLFPRDVTYCNTGTLGAIPREVMDAMVTGLRGTEAALPDWPYFQADGEPLTGYQPLLAARTRAARFLGAEADEIAITQNATVGMNALGNGLDWKAGDEVLTTDQEHGGAVSIFRLMAKRRGIVVKELPLSAAVGGGPEGILAQFRAASSPRTRAIMVSHITSQFGIRMPVEGLIALARERGALSLIDGAQAVGQIRVNLRELGCDAYVASPHKWLMAPKGTGLLYIRRAAQAQFWTTLASYQWDNQEQGAFRFMQYGTGSTALIDGLMAAIALGERNTMERVERWDLMLTTRLREGLAKIKGAVSSSPADPRLASAITTFRVEGVSARDLQNALWARKIRVRAQGDDKGVRLSAHVCVAPADIDVVLEVVAALAAKA